MERARAILLLAPLPEDQKAPGYSTQSALPREILFLPERNPAEEKWTGRKYGPDDETFAGSPVLRLSCPRRNLKPSFDGCSKPIRGFTP